MNKILINKKNDYISIIVPASSCADADIRLQEAIDILSSQGFRVKVDKEIFAGDSLAFFAANKDVRYKAFIEALTDPEVKIIWAFRGGYGCDEFIFDCLDIKPVGSKILIGFSDITSLHLLFNQNYNLSTIHGSVLSTVSCREENIGNIFKILSGKDSKIELTPIANTFDKKIVGKTIGGNLTIVTNMIGTKLHPDTKDKILIIEDTGEKGYQVHRYLMHMKNAELLDNVAAIIFGDFVKSDNNLESAILYFCQNHIPDIPTYRATNIGHGDINYPIIMNTKAIIENNLFSIVNPFRLV
ncbi:MAG: LD-carboxypeptidase [Candidatus Rickettsia vulgarisii]